MITTIVKEVQRLLILMGPSRWRLLAGITGNSLNRLLTVYLGADLLAGTVSACQAGDAVALVYAALGKLPLLALIMAINGVSVYLCESAITGAARSLRTRLFSTMLDSPLNAAQKNHSGRMLSYFANDIPAAVSALSPALTQPVGALFMGIGGLVYVLRVHPRMAFIALSIGVFTFAYSILFAGWLHRVSVKMQELLAVLEIRLRDLLDGMVTARIFGMRDRLEYLMRDTSGKLRDTGVLWAKASALLGGMNNAVSTLTDQVLVFAAGFLFLGGALSMPELIRVSQMAGGIIGVFHVSRLLVGLQKSLAGAERVFGYLDTAQAEYPPEKTGGEKSAEQDVMVELNEISFRYGTVPVLDKFSLKVQKGEFVALIGSSGSGKSSVLRLIQGLYRPASGSVQIEGRDLTEWDLAALRSEVSLVPQEPVLFPGSIAENIAMGTQKVSREQVEAAARKAGAHGFISAMPLGYETPVAERGHSLSGSQRQMIAIARALLRNSPILLFDEATSALDSETENVIYRTFSSLRKEKTILLVTHRLSALKIADRAITVSGA